MASWGCPCRGQERAAARLRVVRLLLGCSAPSIRGSFVSCPRRRPTTTRPRGGEQPLFVSCFIAGREGHVLALVVEFLACRLVAFGTCRRFLLRLSEPKNLERVRADAWDFSKRGWLAFFLFSRGRPMGCTQRIDGGVGWIICTCTVVVEGEVSMYHMQSTVRDACSTGSLTR